MAKQILGQEANLKMLKMAVDNSLSVLLIGDTGCGKTSMVQYLGEQNGKKVIRFNLTGETTVDEFVGNYEVVSGSTVWKERNPSSSHEERMVDYCRRNQRRSPRNSLCVALPLLDDDKSVVVPLSTSPKK